jgi:imidazolonepropionase-like amidohydrolase
MMLHHMRPPSVPIRHPRVVDALWLAVLVVLVSLVMAGALGAQSTASASASVSPPLLLVPDRVFDGTGAPPQSGLAVLVVEGRIAAVAPRATITLPPNTRVLELPGTTLLPGLIDAHSHVLLHPYNEVAWDDQVLREPLGERVARGVVHLERTLQSGFTTLRDLGTEGAASGDVGLRSALTKGVIPGPRLIVAERAIVMRGSYAPYGFAPEWQMPVGAEEAGNREELVSVVRGQIRRGADFIKVYADYRWGPSGEAQPAFTQEELEAAVAVATSSGRYVVAHAVTPDGMRRATLAGVRSIEHGDGGTPDVFRLMKERGVVLVPTISAGHAVTQYGGWNPATQPEPARVAAKRASIKTALASGVAIANGSDVGVFPHGDNARELELLVEYGMTPLQALTAATSTAAALLRLDQDIGTVRVGLIADLLVVRGDPSATIGAVRNVHAVLQGGRLVRAP